MLKQLRKFWPYVSLILLFSLVLQLCLLFPIYIRRHSTSTGITQSSENIKYKIIPVWVSKHQNISKTKRMCSKKKNIAFLKVHKAASSTVSNILQRFALANHLNVVLPNKKKKTIAYNYLGNGRLFHISSVIPIPENETYNILCNHVVYNRTVFHKLLPNDTFYFAILRNPEQRFVSAAFYYGIVKLWRKNIKGINATKYIFSKWLSNPRKYRVSVQMYNNMARDFGVQTKHFMNVTYVDEYIKILDKDFHLALKMEYFDESLVLLRRKLCWSIHDILYIPQNKGILKEEYALSQIDRARLEKWQTADILIYKHFTKRYWKTLFSERSDIMEEVEFFKDTLRRVSDFCLHEQKGMKSITIKGSKWSENFRFSREECKFMLMSELALNDILVDNAWSKYNSSVK